MSQRARIRGMDETLTEAGIKWIVPTAAEIVAVAGAATLNAGDHVVFVASAQAAMTITLPPMAEAVGRFYYIQAPDGATQTVLVQDYEDETTITTYGTMDADDDGALFYCTGIDWVVAFEQVA